LIFDISQEEFLDHLHDHTPDSLFVVSLSRHVHVNHMQKRDWFQQSMEFGVSKTGGKLPNRE
jgi:hypothetical protein